MPLVWAHAEFGEAGGEPATWPPGGSAGSSMAALRRGETAARSGALGPRHMPVARIPQGLPLRLILAAPALVHWGFDEWCHATDARTRPGSLGLHVVDLPTENIANGETLRFSIQDLASRDWIESDRLVQVINRAS